MAFFSMEEKGMNAALIKGGWIVTEEKAAQLLQALRTNEVTEVTVSKEEFPVFRNVLTKQEDMKSFRGAAKHFGTVVYTYEPGWTA
ncbi:hypothetical protein MHH67_11790 [Bacillus sp. FSL K6-0047]|uniref:hypothetical protein n=1 Tax=Shouchella clausii TaxID=79880 RepID=UPI0002FE30B9|nr:hypothetical protein [Shouchella clausii]